MSNHIHLLVREQKEGVSSVMKKIGHSHRSSRKKDRSMWGRKRYFEMRRGDRPITPAQQQDITDTCQFYGWTGPIVYDGEEEGWQW